MLGLIAISACSDLRVSEPTGPIDPFTGPSTGSTAVEVRFRDDLRVRQTAAGPRSLQGRSLSNFDAVVRDHGGEVSPLITLSNDGLVTVESAAQLRSSATPRDLRSWYRVEVSSPEEAIELVSRLSSLAEVDAAQLAPVPVRPPTVTFATPTFTSQQGFFGPAPYGTDAQFARSLPGGAGQGVTIVDLEYDWYLDHEDLALSASALIAGERYTAYGDAHGTAVLGQLVGRDNQLGVTGGVPGATIKLVSPFFNGYYNPANAVAAAAAQMRPGDVLLIEQQAWGPNNMYVPLEWVSSVYDAIRLATQAGIVVVEAGGNCGASLDGPEFGGRFNRDLYDSGAILVGAGSPDRAWQSFSCYGSRMDLQGLGGGVTTTGYGDLYGTSKIDQYTGGFSGTSSASAIVAAAAAAVQGHSMATRGQPLTPGEVVALLRSTGTGQSGDLGRNIGPLPNLRAALGQGTSAPLTAVISGPYTAQEGETVSFSSASSSAGAVTYSWNFGDGTTSALPNPTKSYADDGIYTVSLSIADASGSGASTSTTLSVGNVAPTADFIAPGSIFEGSGYALELTGTDPGQADRSTLQYSFDCGLGSGYGAWGTTVQRSCPIQVNQRSIVVRGRVRDKDGAVTSYSQNLTVVNAVPVVSVIPTTSTSLRVTQLLGVRFGFTDAGTQDSPWAWSISWGDGTPSTTGTRTSPTSGLNVSHRYTKPGTFTVLVTVRDRDGGLGESANIVVTVR